ncbi:MAG: alkaline phosphatase [Candidatus Krumholzibacteriota bacterium]|nr:alkaline phosphatase [Candidatus Krumholzibacteriota bacterium]
MQGKKITVLLLVAAVAIVCFTRPDLAKDTEASENRDDLPVNIILFIGDGMGVAHITAAKTVMGHMQMERLDVCGLVTTHPYGGFVTDSAASGTAMATGQKTRNGMISQGPDGRKLKTVFEYAEEMKKSTGIVVTCSVTHATPAVFIAHVDDRNKNNEIAQQIVVSGIDLLFGGGLAYFIPSSREGSKRSDENDLVKILGERLDIALTAEEFRNLSDTANAAAFTALRHPGKVSEREISLAEMTGKALQILSKDPDGFLLMVEGSQIDWEGHDNNLDGIIAETVDFDNAVGVGIDFAESDGRTLVIVTSDHETGGFAVHGGSIEEKTLSEASFTTGGHTGSMVPLLAFGPGARLFGGIHDNTFIGKSMIEFLSSSK